MYLWLSILVLLSIAEVVLFVLLIVFFRRLRRSEELLTRLSDGQNSLLDKIKTNADLERELMGSFITRQAELTELNKQLAKREDELRKLLEEADVVTRSPQFLRELIAQGRKKGRSPEQLAKGTGLSLDEVELILSQMEK